MKHSHLFCETAGRMDLRHSDSLPLLTGEVRVAAHFSGVSPGTKSRCFAGAQPGTPPEGFIPGYQCAGEVVESASELFAQGDRVFCTGTSRSPLPRMWGGHTSEAVIPADKAFRLPAHTPLSLAALAKLAAIARHGLRLAAPLPSERIAVVGLGPIGFFSAAILRLLGHAPVAFDLSPERCALFQSMGGNAVLIDRNASVSAQIAAAAQPDLLIDATGAPALLGRLLEAGPDLPWGETLRRGLRLVVQGSYPDNVVFPYDSAFTREVTLLFPRDNCPSDLRDVLAWMANGQLALPADAFALASPSRAQSVYSALAGARSLPLTTVFAWKP
jgi:2-desacetyl-2-hydroxyethyl bacteriochlorophyllide A dehydrogenase